METTEKFSVNLLGDETQRAYTGTFTVKVILTQSERFMAEQNRRDLIGPNGSEALSALQTQAFMMGQLAVRIVKGPDWWEDSRGGRELQDSNLISEIFNLAINVEEKFKADLKAEAQAALKKLKASKKSDAAE